MFPEMAARRLQLLLLEEISEGVGYGRQVPLDLYRISAKPDIYGLMYGQSTIYYGSGRDCPSFPQFGESFELKEYREIGTPMYKLSASRSWEYLRNRNLLMHGTNNIGPKQVVHRPDHQFPIILPSRVDDDDDDDDIEE